MRASPTPAGRPSPQEAGGRLGSLFDTHGHMVLGLCRFLLRDADEAQDATQQTFLSAYRGLLGGTEPRSAAPWLAEIARNECRARIATRMREPLPLSATMESTGDDPADAADQAEQLDALKAAIAELPERQREAVVLRDFYGLSYREVAAAMTVSVPVVESLLFRARRRLGRRLGTLPRLAQGALTVPLVLRDELARSIPGFDAAAAGLGIGGGGAAAGVVAKLAALPATAKVATAGSVAAVAVGGAVSPQVIEQKPPKPSTTAAAAPATSSEQDAKPQTGSARSAESLLSQEREGRWDNRGRKRAKASAQRASIAARSAANDRDDSIAESGEPSEAEEVEVEEADAVEIEGEDAPQLSRKTRTVGAGTPEPPESEPVETETGAESDAGEDEGAE